MNFVLFTVLFKQQNTNRSNETEVCAEWEDEHQDTEATRKEHQENNMADQQNIKSADQFDFYQSANHETAPVQQPKWQERNRSHINTWNLQMLRLYIKKNWKVQKQLERVLKNIQRFHSYRRWNIVLDSGLWLGSLAGWRKFWVLLRPFTSHLCLCCCCVCLCFLIGETNINNFVFWMNEKKKSCTRHRAPTMDV